MPYILRSTILQVPRDGREQCYTVHHHTVHATCHFSLSCDEFFRYLDVVVDYGCRSATSCLPLQSFYVQSEYLFSDLNVLGGDRIIGDSVHSQHRLKIVDRRRSESVVEVASTLSSLELSLSVEALVLFHCVQKLRLLARWLVHIQVIADLIKSYSLVMQMDFKCILLFRIVRDTKPICHFNVAENICDGFVV